MDSRSITSARRARDDERYPRVNVIARRGGRIYGRGACDMKGGLAASIIAVEALIDSGEKLPGTLEISGTVDEESGGFGGVHFLAQRGWFSPPRVDHVIIAEG